MDKEEQSTLVIKIIKVITIVIACVMILNIIVGVFTYWIVTPRLIDAETSSQSSPFKEAGDSIEEAVEDIGEAIVEVSEQLNLGELVSEIATETKEAFEGVLSGEYKIGLTSLNQLRETYVLDGKEYKAFSLDVHNTIVEYVPTKSEGIKIEAYYNDNLVSYRVEEKGEEVIITREDDESVRGGQKEGRLVIYLPKEYILEEVLINTTNGIIRIDGVIAQSVEVYTTNAMIELKNIESKDINLKTTNGLILIDKVYGNNLSVDTDNAFVKGNEIYVKDLGIRTINGGVILYNKDKDYIIENLKVDTKHGMNSIGVAYKTGTIQ